MVSSQLNPEMKRQCSSANLHTAASVKNDVSLLLREVFTDIVGQRGGSKYEPALRPVLPLVAFLHHVTL